MLYYTIVCSHAKSYTNISMITNNRHVRWSKLNVLGKIIFT